MAPRSKAKKVSAPSTSLIQATDLASTSSTSLPFPDSAPTLPSPLRRSSLRNHPSIIAEICQYLLPHQLARVLRVNRQCFEVAGQKLYRDIKIVPGAGYQRTNLAIPYRHKGLPSPTKSRLFEFVRTVDITESAAIWLDNAQITDMVCRRTGTPYALPHLRTLILRTDPVDIPAGRIVHPVAPWFLVGLQPEHLLLVGDLAALARISRYPHVYGSEPAHWPSVKRLEHIIPYKNPHPYPTPFIISSGDRDSVASFPNLLSYDIFFDISSSQQDLSITGMLRAELHFARTVAWTIRNSREVVPVTIWLSPLSETAFIQHKRLIKRAICQTLRADQYLETGCSQAFPLWDEARFLSRVAHVRAYMCSPAKMARWDCVRNGWADGVASRVWRSGVEEVGGEAGRVDWDDVQPGDDGADVLSVFEYDSEEEQGETESEEGENVGNFYGYSSYHQRWIYQGEHLSSDDSDVAGDAGDEGEEEDEGEDSDEVEEE
ncbi:uncharacterized protein MKK02DRAFT_44485 [Dioszegia hungarica]|uniref:Uncharacterized protein n=1 Tax=Dioszegia hungarica TaxID=4972 RepID=A0AA38HAU4_9TREE|nr:uncharacterized protein MKK02DRAFT_44485 [Dioszegia hungarica]KAI9635786.1 hypothetical protein MKK02DRAFT_44485 [Dioszegia hungarica]